jgi:hypothetical protein
MKPFIYCLLSFILINWACRKEDPYGIVTGHGSVFKDGERFEIKHYAKNVYSKNDTLNNVSFSIFYKNHEFGKTIFNQIPLFQREIKLYAPPYDTLTKKYDLYSGLSTSHYYSKCDDSCIAGAFTLLEDHPDNNFTIEKLEKRNVYQIKFNLVFERDKYFTAIPVDPVEPRDTIYLTNGVFDFVIKEE